MCCEWLSQWKIRIKDKQSTAHFFCFALNTIDDIFLCQLLRSFCRTFFPHKNIILATHSSLNYPKNDAFSKMIWNTLRLLWRLRFSDLHRRPNMVFHLLRWIVQYGPGFRSCISKFRLDKIHRRASLPNESRECICILAGSSRRQLERGSC